MLGVIIMAIVFVIVAYIVCGLILKLSRDIVDKIFREVDK